MFVVARDQLPIRFSRTIDQRIGDLGVQPSPHAWGCQFGGDLAQQLVSKTPRVGSPPFEHPRIFKLTKDFIDRVVAQVDHRAQ